MWNGAYMEKTEEVSRVVVSDAGPLIHLDELGCLELLDYPEVLVPEAVWREVARHRPQALQSPSVSLKLERVDSLPPRLEAISPLFGLHHGEQEALLVPARQRRHGRARVGRPINTKSS